jgi:alkylation response protein AidB-like acyl-CoA dehydrogenase
MSDLPAPAARRFLGKLERALRAVDGDAIDRDDKVPPRVVAALKGLGVFRMRVPRAHGGLGLSVADHHRAVALVARRSLGLSMWVTTHDSLAGVALLQRAGTAEQRAALLPRLARGELSALAVSEEDAGADLKGLKTTARRARGGWRIDGRKVWITNAPVARWIAVLARAPQGPAVFLVDARAGGVALERRCSYLGLRGMENGVLRFKGAFVPDSRRLGAEGDGPAVVLGALSSGRLTVAPRALGLARACRDASRAWAARRRQFGRRLADLPAPSLMLARLDALVAGLEGLTARAAALGALSEVPRRESMSVKLRAADAAYEAAELAVRLRGPRGYETAASQRARGEAPVPAERWLRDARGLRAIEGSEDVLRAALARRREAR